MAYIKNKIKGRFTYFIIINDNKILIIISCYKVYENVN